jgi:hypothetical protein
MQDSEEHFISHCTFSDKAQIYSTGTSPPKTQQKLNVGYLFMSTTLSAALAAWLPGRPTRPPRSSGSMGIPNKEGQHLKYMFWDQYNVSISEHLAPITKLQDTTPLKNVYKLLFAGSEDIQCCNL